MKQIRPIKNAGSIQARRFSLSQMMLMVFNIACFISFTRFAHVAAIGPYSSIDFVLGVLCLVLFPIGVGMMNRGSFVTMVAAFGVAVGTCILVGYVASGRLF